MATLTALIDCREVFPNHRPGDIQDSIDKGLLFLKSIQRSDGSWYGCWACCFTYGTFFGVEGLVKCGEPLDSPCILQACEFLLKHQRPNGGWGEDFTSCYDKDYAKDGMKSYGDGGSSIINTAWALLALSVAKCKDVDAVRRGVRYLIKRQLSCGDWPQEGISGVFNRSVGITYTAYRNVFPIWALGRCYHAYGDVLDETN
jgi:cycloartenol synthase